MTESNPSRRNIAEGRNSFAYPIGFQASDGLIHIVYTSDQRSVINHAVFNEEWVTERHGSRSKAWDNRDRAQSGEQLNRR